MAVCLCNTKSIFPHGQAAPNFRVEQLPSLCGQAGLQPDGFFFLVQRMVLWSIQLPSSALELPGMGDKQKGEEKHLFCA